MYLLNQKTAYFLIYSSRLVQDTVWIQANPIMWED